VPILLHYVLHYPILSLLAHLKIDLYRETSAPLLISIVLHVCTCIVLPSSQVVVCFSLGCACAAPWSTGALPGGDPSPFLLIISYVSAFYSKVLLLWLF
jgi:hypothetical protein